MKIGFWGEGPWAHDSLERLLRNDSFHVLFVVGRASVYDRTLENIAGKGNIPFFRPNEANSQEFLRIIAGFAPDINVSMSYDQIIRNKLLQIAPLGFINCHAGALPFYRGRNVLNWALINGEKQFGITVHYIDEGIDTGDIIKQEFIEITADDDYGTVLKKAEENCPRILQDALCDIAAGTGKRIPQKTIHPVGFYCGKRIDGDEKIDWNWSSERIHNFVRGIALPAPCARSFVEEKEVRISATSLVADAPAYIGTAGEVVGRCNEGNIVKTGDTVILLRRILLPDEKESISVPSFRIGTRFSTVPLKRMTQEK